MQLTVYRGSREIGGNCVEIRAGSSRIVVDLGIPLFDADGGPLDAKSLEGKSTEELLERNILPRVPGLFAPGHALVAFIRAAMQTERTFVADIYCAYVIHLIALDTIPKPTREDGIPVFYPSRLAASLKRRRLDNMFLDSQITLAEILETPTRHIMLFRPPMIEDDFRGRMPGQVRCLYSRFEGYLDQPDWIDARSKIEAAEGDLIPVHTSGHIFVQDIAEFVRQVNPRLLVPIHTRSPEAFQGVFAPVRVLSDGEPLEVI